MGVHVLKKFRSNPRPRAKPEELAVTQEDRGGRRAAERPRGIGQGLEDGVQIERRTADDLEDIRRRGLLLQRFLKILRPRLDLVEKPHVFDRDHRLVGESTQQLHVGGDKSARLFAGDADQASGHAVAHQRRKQHAAKAAQSP